MNKIILNTRRHEIYIGTLHAFGNIYVIKMGKTRKYSLEI
jgi:hypothetical protein